MTSNTEEELLDVIDKNDNVIGQASRSECHSNPNLIHRTIQFTLINKITNKILITQRSFNKEHDAGKLVFLGEHVLAGESYRDALVRGVTEELGFTPKEYYECATNTFSYDKQTELIKFYLISHYNQKLTWDKTEMETIFWIDLHQLTGFNDYSDMTGYWIKNIDWDKYLD